MANSIEVIKAVPVPMAPARLRSVLLAAAGLPELAGKLPVSGWSLSLRLSGDRELHRLNRQFLDEDHATDVLSFPSGDGGEYLGDIVISWPATQRQAVEFGHPAESELALLVVHGLLHLLGWDHQDVREENAMNRVTVMALAKSGHRLAPGRLSVAAG